MAVEGKKEAKLILNTKEFANSQNLTVWTFQ